jgi:hypothetical protein
MQCVVELDDWWCRANQWQHCACMHPPPGRGGDTAADKWMGSSGNHHQHSVATTTTTDRRRRRASTTTTTHRRRRRRLTCRGSFKSRVLDIIDNSASLWSATCEDRMQKGTHAADRDVPTSARASSSKHAITSQNTRACCRADHQWHHRPPVVSVLLDLALSPAPASGACAGSSKRPGACSPAACAAA